MSARFFSDDLVAEVYRCFPLETYAALRVVSPDVLVLLPKFSMRYVMARRICQRLGCPHLHSEKSPRVAFLALRVLLRWSVAGDGIRDLLGLHAPIIDCRLMADLSPAVRSEGVELLREVCVHVSSVERLLVRRHFEARSIIKETLGSTYDHPGSHPLWRLRRVKISPSTSCKLGCVAVCMHGIRVSSVFRISRSRAILCLAFLALTPFAAVFFVCAWSGYLEYDRDCLAWELAGAGVGTVPRSICLADYAIREGDIEWATDPAMISHRDLDPCLRWTSVFELLVC